MIRKVKLKYVDAVETGVMDLGALRGNFDEIKEVMDAYAEKLEALALMQTQTISFGIDSPGLKTILKPNRHNNVNIINAFVQMGDNIKEEIIVGLVGISDTIKFSKTEKSGKVRMFSINNEKILSDQGIVVSTSSNRRVIVNVTVEGVEK